MSSRALLWLLLLLSACSASPARQQAPADRRTLWRERVRGIRPEFDRKDIEAFLDSVRVPAAHRPPYLSGGGFSDEDHPMTHFELYSLDETFALYLVWKGEPAKDGIRSAEVVAFEDLKSRVDPALWDAVEAIHRSPSGQQGLGFDPVCLIRAVNALQPLGKEKALEALRAYDRLAGELSFADHHKYQIDEYRILPIVQLLFESPAGSMPPFALGAGDLAPPEPPHCPLFPLVLSQDVPFMLVTGYTLAGIPEMAADRLKLKLGPIRSAPLSPRVTALEAADDLIRSEAWAALGLQAGQAGRKRWELRRQALRALSTVFAPRPEETTNDCCVDPTETQWRATVARASSSGVLWSPEIQDFILGR